MITVFFNEDGYYIAGDGIEIARRCSPATTIRGDRIFQAIHHTYRVLYLALCELLKVPSADVMVYNDSRIIDEINGTVGPIDETCQEWLETIKRRVVPEISGVVFFRKQSDAKIRSQLQDAYNKMLPPLDPQKREAIMTSEQKRQKTITKHRKQRLVDRLRHSWFGDNTNGK